MMGSTVDYLYDIDDLYDLDCMICMIYMMICLRCEMLNYQPFWEPCTISYFIILYHAILYSVKNKAQARS